jgi:hypothetical protein
MPRSNTNCRLKFATRRVTPSPAPHAMKSESLCYYSRAPNGSLLNASSFKSERIPPAAEARTPVAKFRRRRHPNTGHRAAIAVARAQKSGASTLSSSTMTISSPLHSWIPRSRAEVSPSWSSRTCLPRECHQISQTLANGCLDALSTSKHSHRLVGTVWPRSDTRTRLRQ